MLQNLVKPRFRARSEIQSSYFPNQTHSQVANRCFSLGIGTSTPPQTGTTVGGLILASHAPKPCKTKVPRSMGNSVFVFPEPNSLPRRKSLFFLQSECIYASPNWHNNWRSNFNLSCSKTL